MNTSRLRLSALLIGALACCLVVGGLLTACGGGSNGSSLVGVESYELEFEAEFVEQAAGDVEIKRITGVNREFTAREAAYIEFENENMALAVPLNILTEAERADAAIAMRYVYPDAEGHEAIDFYLPTVPEYRLYFPEAQEEDVSLLVADVVLAEEQAVEAREQLTNLGYEVVNNEPVYSVMAYLLHTKEGATTAIKLDSFNNSITMTQAGAVDEQALQSQLYLSTEGKVYRPSTVSYSSNEENKLNFSETYFNGSFITTQGSLIQTNYADIQGHYSQSAIEQVQKSYNMAYLIAGDAAEFEPDLQASSEDIGNASAAFAPVPLIDTESFTQMKDELAADYAKAPVFGSLEGQDEDFLLRSFQARTPYWTAEQFEKLSSAGSMDVLESRGYTASSRICVALEQLGIYYDLTMFFVDEDEFSVTPSEVEVEQWLLGIKDVDVDDPLRAMAALAVHKGLLTPDAEGNLNMYEPITRAELCVSYANMSTFIAGAIAQSEELAGYTQQYHYAKDDALVFDVLGTWEFAAAVRADGTSYTQEEIDADDASFEFKLGDSLELWGGEEYLGTYWFSLEHKIITVGYDYGVYYDDSRYESFQISDDLTELTYYYVNEEDPEFSGETYYFKRV